MRSLVLSSLVLALLVACGPGPTPETPSPGADAGAAPAKTTPLPPDGGSAEAKPAGDGLAQNKKAFMDQCTRAGDGTGPFCECAWTALLGSVGEAKLAAEGPSERDVLEARSKMMVTCKSKLPEDAVKQAYMTDCVADHTEMQPYCDCSWTEYRKDFSAGDLSDEATMTSEKGQMARAKVTKTCGPKISEKAVKESFIKGCVRDPKLDKFCGCAWDELKKMGSAAEIQNGMLDPKKLNTNLEKSCAKYKPASATAPAAPKP
jgi:hypothetical protein